MASNPFEHQRPVFAADTFLDREKETKELRKLILSHRNLLIYGLRRRGKSSLICRVLATLPKTHASLYVDAYRTVDDDELGVLLLNQLAQTGLGKGARFAKWCRELLSHLSYTAEIGTVDAPIRFKVQRNHDAQRLPLLDALEFIGRVAEDSKKHVVIVIDEFQKVMEQIGDDGLWAMRSVAQMQDHVSYVFSGSRPTILKTLASGPDKGFWTQLTQYPVPGLTVMDIHADIERHFGSKVPHETTNFLLEHLGDNTQRLVQVLRHAYDAEQSLTLDAMQHAFESAVAENTPGYEGQLEGIRSRLERHILFALARNPTETPTGTAWIRDVGLKASPSGVHQALARLRDANHLDEDNDFVDPLFRAYLTGA